VRRYRTVWTRLKEHRKNLFHFQRTARGRFRDLKKREGMLKRRMDHLMEIHINLVNELLEAAE
jgi:hypothetical protein